MYLTPPLSSAVNAHTDDRDVLILQIHGRKKWTVWNIPPIPFPFKEEEMGKTNRVPDDVLMNDSDRREFVMEPGDVLYLPRGYLHVAKTLSDASSLHMTLAIATSQWTLGTLITRTIQNAFRSNPSFARYRRSISLPVRESSDEKYMTQFKHEISSAFSHFSEGEGFCAENVLRTFNEHIREKQNERMEEVSKHLIHVEDPLGFDSLVVANDDVVISHCDVMLLNPKDLPEKRLPRLNTILHFQKGSSSSSPRRMKQINSSIIIDDDDNILKLQMILTNDVAVFIRDLFPPIPSDSEEKEEGREIRRISQFPFQDSILQLCVASTFLKNGCLMKK